LLVIWQLPVFLNRLFIPIFIGICLSTLVYLIFAFDHKSVVDIREDKVSLNTANTLYAELDMLLDTVDIIIKSEEYVRPYFDASVKRLSLSVMRNVESFAKECPDNIGERLIQFAEKIRRGSSFITNFQNESPDTINISEFRKDIWTLKNLVLLGTRKIKEDEIIRKRDFNNSSKKRVEQYFTIIFVISFLLLIHIVILQIRIRRIGKIIGTGKETNPEKVSLYLEKMKEEITGDNDELQKKLFREQVVGRRKGALLDTIPAGIISMDSNREVTYINEKMKTWFNINDELIGENIEKLFSKLRIAGFEEGKMITNGNCYWVSIHEELNEIFVVLRNITEQEDLSRKLLDSERLVSIGEMASRITHEIRNPLSTIKLNSEYMVENISEMDESQIVLSMELIIKEVKRLETITEKYMNLVRYKNSDEVENEVSLPIDILQFISFHAAEFDKRKIELVTTGIPSCDLAITVSSFKEIMLNLLKNSWEELELSGKVVVRVETDGVKAFIRVEDSGKGVPDNEKEDIFKNFYTKKPGGTGIGLSHSRKLANEAGGSLTVIDSDLGGACFILEIPLKLSA